MANTQSDFAGGRQWSVPVRGALAVVASVLVNAALVWALDAAGVAPDFRALTYPPVVFLSALGAVGATVVYVLLARYVDEFDRTFVRVVAAVLVLSFLPDLGLLAADPAATVPGVLALIVMHVVVAVASVVALVAGGAPR